MPLGQSFLNAWVKVNSKHIVIPPTNKNEKDELNHGRGGKGSVTTARTVTTSEDTETQVIRRFDNRKKRKKGSVSKLTKQFPTRTSSLRK